MEIGSVKRVKFEPLLGGLALLILLWGSGKVLQPFFSALIWAIVLAFLMNPLQKKFTKWFRSSSLAACLVTLTLAIFLTGPIVAVGFSFAEDGKALANATRSWFLALPEKPPEWVKKTPLVGSELEDHWATFAESRKKWMDQLDAAAVEPPPPRAEIVREPGEADAPFVPTASAHASDVKSEQPKILNWMGRSLAWARTGLISITLAVSGGILHVLLSAFLAFFLLRDAPSLVHWLTGAAAKIAPGRGERLLKVAGDTVRGVIYGFIGTALAQAIVAGVGFFIAGIPGAILLTVLTFFLAMVPMGPPLVWVPASLWLFSQNRTGWGIFMLIWGGLGISGVDNFVRPILISQGSKMPFILIFCGCVGGVVTFGFVGIFLGPTLLAVTYRLIQEWSGPELLTPGISR